MKTIKKPYVLFCVLNVVFYEIVSSIRGFSNDVRELYFFAILFAAGIFFFMDKDQLDSITMIKLMFLTFLFHLGVGIIG